MAHRVVNAWGETPYVSPLERNYALQPIRLSPVAPEVPKVAKAPRERKLVAAVRRRWAYKGHYRAVDACFPDLPAARSYAAEWYKANMRNGAAPLPAEVDVMIHRCRGDLGCQV